MLCFAHVTNQMARIAGDFEKGEADGTVEALGVIRATAEAWQKSTDSPDRAINRRDGAAP